MEGIHKGLLGWYYDVVLRASHYRLLQNKRNNPQTEIVRDREDQVVVDQQPQVRRSCPLEKDILAVQEEERQGGVRGIQD